MNRRLRLLAIVIGLGLVWSPPLRAGAARLEVAPTGLLLPADSSAVTPDGRIQIFSPRRVCRAEALPGDGTGDVFLLRDVSVWSADSLLYRVTDPCGDGLYLSDTGWLATVTAEGNPWGNKRLRLYARNGRLAAQAELLAPHAFALSGYGHILAAAGAEETVVLAGESGRVWRLPAALQVAVSRDGSTVATADSRRVRVWRDGVEQAEFQVQEPTVRSLALDGRGRRVALATRTRLRVWDVPERRLLFERGAGSRRTFREVRFWGDRLAVGLQQRTRGETAGVAWLLGPEGRILERRSSGAENLPTLPRELRKTSKPEENRPFIRWPYAPFDSVYAIGNTYEEFQRYAGYPPYLHPGVDLLAPPATPVYSVSDGVVKAVLTISGQWHWRIAVGDSATPDTSEGWLYAHLEQTSIAFGVGDTVHLGDYLGKLVYWPTHNFHHCHFVKVREAGVVWDGRWDAVFNPLDVLRPRTDSTAPVFSAITLPDGRRVLAAFCENETDRYLSPDSVRGKVDVVVKVADHVGSPDWACSVYELSYTVRDLRRDSVVVGPVLAAHLSHVIPRYLGTPALTHVLYKDDDVLRSFGDYDARIFYHVVTNSDGDSLLELSDTQRCLDTTVLPDGPYEIKIVARDAAGNRTDWRVPFRVENHSATGVAEQKDERTPRRFTISRPYPNPFNGRTVVFGEASGGDRVRVSVFDARGRLVERTRLVPRGGRFRWVWAARDLPSGVYLARFSCGPERRLVKLLLLR